MQLVSVKPGTKIDNAYCRDEVVMEELSDDSMIKLTSFSRTMNCLIMHIKQWSCFMVSLQTSLLPTCSLATPQPDLNPVDYCIWRVMQERVHHTPIQDMAQVDEHVGWLPAQCSS